MSKDLIDDSYGRFYHIPQELVGLGCKVAGVCWSYKDKPENNFLFNCKQNSVKWRSVNLGKFYPYGIAKYLRSLHKDIIKFRPDIVWACSDAFHASIGGYIEKVYKIPCVIDLYDNFESYTATSIPGISTIYKKSVSSVSGVSCISDTLCQHIKNQYRLKGNVFKLQNAIPENMFKTIDKYKCRRSLGLPHDAVLIGTAGAISHNRGVSTLFEAFRYISNTQKNIYLVLAGPKDNDVTLPQLKNLIYLGNLDYNKIPVFINSLDISIICNINTSFGNYCFPQKFYEIAACKKPLIAAKLGDLSKICQSYPESLYEPSDSKDLAEKLKSCIENRTIIDTHIPTWKDLSEILLSNLSHICDKSSLQPR